MTHVKKLLSLLLVLALVLSFAPMAMADEPETEEAQTVETVEEVPAEETAEEAEPAEEPEAADEAEADEDLEPVELDLATAPLLGTPVSDEGASESCHVAKLTIGDNHYYYFKVQDAIDAAESNEATVTLYDHLEDMTAQSNVEAGSATIRELEGDTTALTDYIWVDSRDAVVKECIVIGSGQDITLDLNGQLLMNDTTGKENYKGVTSTDTIANHGKLTIKDSGVSVSAGDLEDVVTKQPITGRMKRGTIANSSGGVIFNYPSGDLTVERARLTMLGQFGVANVGTAKFDSGTEIGCRYNRSVVLSAPTWPAGDPMWRDVTAADYVASNVSLTVAGGSYYSGTWAFTATAGTFIMSDATVRSKTYAVTIKDAASASLTRCTLIGAGSKSLLNIRVPAGVTYQLSGCTLLDAASANALQAVDDSVGIVRVSDCYICGILSAYDGDIVLGSGNNLHITNLYTKKTGRIVGDIAISGTAKISGGEITGSLRADTGVVMTAGTVNSVTSPSISISGGTVKGTLDVGTTGKLDVTGGIFENASTLAIAKAAMEDAYDGHDIRTAAGGLLYDNTLVVYTADERLVTRADIVARVGTPEDNLYYDSIQTAVDATDPSRRQTVTLEKDTKSAAVIDADDDLTLDLAGYTFYNTQMSACSTAGGTGRFSLGVAGTVRVVDSGRTDEHGNPVRGAINPYNAIAGDSGGADAEWCSILVMNGGSLTLGASTSDDDKVVIDNVGDSASASYGILNGGTVVINNAEVRGIRSAIATNAGVGRANAAMLASPPSITIKGGHYTAEDTSYAVIDISYGTCTINGGTVDSEVGNRLLWVRNDAGAEPTLTVAGGEFERPASATYNIGLLQIGSSSAPGGTINVIGGTLNSSGKVAYVYGAFNMSGGGLTGDSIVLRCGNGCKVSVSGGSISARTRSYHAILAADIVSSVTSEMYIHVSGGTFVGRIAPSEVPFRFTGSNGVSTINLDGLTNGCEISGGTVTNVTIADTNTAPVSISGSASVTTLNCGASTGSVTIDGAATIKNFTFTSGTNNISMTSGTVTGTITDKTAYEEGDARPKFISGGSFSATTCEAAQNYVDSENGFAVKQSAPYNVYTTAADKIAAVNGTFYPTAEEALENATSGNTVTLYQDAELTASTLIPAGVTLALNGSSIDAGENYVAIFGEVIDSTGGASVIQTEENNFFLTTAADGAVPVYDSTAGGYRMASVSVQSADSKSTPALSTPEGTVKFAFRPDFITDVATAVGRGDSLLTVGVDAEYNDQLLRFTYSDTLVTNAMNDATYALTLTVRGLGALSSIKFTPFVESAKAAGRYEADSVTVNLSEA